MSIIDLAQIFFVANEYGSFQILARTNRKITRHKINEGEAAGSEQIARRYLREVIEVESQNGKRLIMFSYAIYNWRFLLDFCLIIFAFQTGTRARNLFSISNSLDTDESKT